MPFIFWLLRFNTTGSLEFSTLAVAELLFSILLDDDSDPPSCADDFISGVSFFTGS